MKYLYCIFALSFLTVSCATPQQPADVRYGVPVKNYPSLKPSRRVEPATTSSTTSTRTQRVKGAGVSLATAASAPLDDFNLRRPVAPRALEDLGYIYQATPRPDCPAIARELYVVSEALGEIDADDLALAQAEKRTKGQVAGDTTLEVVRSTSSSLIPFSGLIRTASGATAARRHYDAKFDKGRRRRAFLKGYALGIGCNPPVSPKVLDVPELPVDIEYNRPTRSTRR